MMRWLSSLWSLVLLVALLAGAPAAAQEWRVAPDDVFEEVVRPPLPAAWDTIESPAVRVHGHEDHAAVRLALSRHAADSLPRLAAELGVPIGATVDVYVAESTSQFHALQPGSPPDWADGTAYPRAGLVFLRRPGIRGPQATPLEQVLDHELVHVLLGRAFAPQTPPRWLQEGMAKVYSGEHAPDAVQRLARGMVRERGLLTLDELSHGFPDDPLRAELAYAQSADFVAWMRATYGDDAVRTLVREMAAGRSVKGAIRSATGRFLEDVDASWRATLQQGATPLWVSALGAPDAWWAGSGVLAVVALGTAWRRRRRRLEDYVREEREREALLWALLHTHRTPVAADEYVH